jgi:hypothetical protein
MAILKDSRFWIGVAVGAFVVPVGLRMVSNRSAKA